MGARSARKCWPIQSPAGIAGTRSFLYPVLPIWMSLNRTMANDLPPPSNFQQTPPQYTARRKPETLALMGDLRVHEMITLEARLKDIQRAEEHGFDRHFRVAGEVLFGAVIGAWVTGARFFPAVLVLAVSIASYLASMAISEAHADSISSFSRDFTLITNNLELVQDGEKPGATSGE